jgi:hypothetical protein
MSVPGPSVVLPLLLGIALAPASLAGQSAAEVFTRMLAEQDRRAAGVENYTVVQEVMGQVVTTYLVKDASGPHAIFRAQHTQVEGMGMAAVREAEDVSADLWADLPSLGAQARYLRRETRDGRAVHVVEVPDLGRTAAFRNARQAAGGELEIRKGTFFVDAEQWVPRRLVFEGRMTTPQKTANVTMTMDLQDYREVDGLLHPFRTIVRVDGMVSPEDRARYAEMKKQLDELPPAQRQMMENMMKGQLAQLERMMGDDGSMNFESTVREVRVNAGAPK